MTMKDTARQPRFVCVDNRVVCCSTHSHKGQNSFRGTDAQIAQTSQRHTEARDRWRDQEVEGGPDLDVGPPDVKGDRERSGRMNSKSQSRLGKVLTGQKLPVEPSY